MRQMRKRVFSGLLFFALMFHAAGFDVFAHSGGNVPTAEEGRGEAQARMTPEKMEMRGENSVGGLLVNTLEDSAGEAGESASYRVVELNMQNGTATVRYQAEKICDLVVAVYSEDGSQMYGSGSTKAVPGEDTLQVTVSISEWPDYYLTRAFLLEEDSHEALCEQYTDDTHTKDFQDFLGQTVDDPAFRNKEILNLDDNKSMNFAVFSEGTVIVKESVGGIAVTDNKNGVYSIANATDEIKALKKGDVFVYQHSDGETLIVVASEDAAVDGDTVTVRDDPDASLEDVFEYAKIEGKTKQAVLDDSAVSSGITPVSSSGRSARVSENDGEEKKVEEKKYIFNNGFEATFRVEAEVNVYVRPGWVKATATLTGEMKLNGKLDASFSAEKDFENFSAYKMYPVAGVEVSFTPGVKLTATGSITVNASVKSVSGFGYDSGRKGDKFYDLSTRPRLVGEIKTEIEIYVGVRLTPKISVISPKVASMALTAEAGCKINLKSSNKYDSEDDSCRHPCTLCYAGEVWGNIKFTGTITLVNKEPMTKDLPLNEMKVMDFYVSLRDGKLEWAEGKCPHITYKVEIKAIDTAGMAAGNVRATVQYRDSHEEIEEYKNTRTGTDGKMKIYMAPGSYMIILNKDSLLATQAVKVEDAGQEHTAVMEDKGCGENLYWSLDDGGTLSVIGTGPMFDWTSSKEVPWAGDRSKVEALYISEGVTYLGDYAFFGCPGGKSELKLPQTLTAIGDYTFSGVVDGFHFTGELVIPENVTRIGEHCFEDSGAENSRDESDNVTKVVFGSRLTEIGEQSFSGFRCNCELILPDSLEVIPEWAFTGSRFTGVKLGENVKEICDHAFDGCGYMTGDLVIPDKVTRIGKYAFSDCRAFDGQLTLGEHVEQIGEYAFGPFGQLSAYKGDGFTGQLYIPDSVTVIETGAFRDCSKLTSLTFGSGSRLETIHTSAFEHCTSLGNHLSIPDSVTQIGKTAFSECGFSGLTLGAGLKGIGANAFYDCAGMTGSLTLPSGLESLGGFNGCSGFTGSIEIPDSVTEILDYAFARCSGLDGTLSLPSGLKTIGKHAFKECGNLSGELEIPSGVTEIEERVFSGCGKITGELLLPENIRKIASSAFENCSSLTSIVFGGNVRSIYPHAFAGCTGLTGITFQGKAPDVMVYSFEGVKATVYYPADDSSWNEKVMDKSSGEFTWESYATASTYLSGVEAEPAAADEEHVFPEEMIPEEPEMPDEFRQDTENDVAALHSSVGGTFSTSSGNLKAEFKDLIPEGVYIVLAVRNQSTGNLTDPENLLYISQEKADADGRISLNCRPVDVADTMSVRVYGGLDWNLEKAAAQLSQSSYTYNGNPCAPAVTVTYNNKKLVAYKDYTITYESNLNAGTARAVINGTGDYKGRLVKEFTIRKASQTIEASCPSSSIRVGEKVTITASAPGEISFSSGNKGIAEVNSKGEVTGKSVGSVRITITAAENENYLKKTKTLSFYVSKKADSDPNKEPGKTTSGSGTVSPVKVTGITLSGISKKIAAGKKITLTASVIPKNAGNRAVKWSSSNKNVAKVSQKGVVSVNKKAGGKSVKITATTKDGSGKKAVYTIKVMKGVVKKVAISGNRSIQAGKSLKLKGTVKATKGANKKLKWNSSNKKYAKVSSGGKVTTYKKSRNKKVRITAMATDGSGRKKTVTIQIK